MSHFLTRYLPLLALALLAGCTGQNQPGPKAGSPAAPERQASAQDKATEATVPEGLAELSGEDRILAEKQRVCPVTGALLGSMGKPEKVTVKGQTVFLCCSGCEDDLKKDPDEFLAKLKAAEKK